MDLQGNIDLLKLELAGVATIHGKKCVVIPIAENDIFIKADETTNKAITANLSINIFERQKKSQWGQTHYAKLSLSKKYRDDNQEATERKKKVYIGEFKPLEFSSADPSAPFISDEYIDPAKSALPF